jgi:hypothetical protein
LRQLLAGYGKGRAPANCGGGRHDLEKSATGDHPILTGKIAWRISEELPDS